MKSLLSLAGVVLFATSVLAQDAAAPEVIDAANLDVLRAKAGTEVIVEGPVTDVGTTKTGGITFINIGAPKKQGFVAVVFQDNYGAFAEGFDKYKAQKVRVQGVVDLYRGEQPQIKLSSPDQITIVSEESPAAAQ
jgi:DNA/RNA endonuclease YhcR with UshA esterase domain